MFDKLKNLFKKSPKVEEAVKVSEPKQKKPRKTTEDKIFSEKDRANIAGEPYINITKLDIDPTDINNGSFELDFNDKFVINLIKAGYKVKKEDTDVQVVDRWFQTVCRNVALEIYEQQQADPDNRNMLGMRDMRSIAQKDLGNGRTEVS